MSNFLKGTPFHSILFSSCPVCQEENMYLDPNPYHLRNAFKMHERCSHCGTKYKIEPSFFFGAMYVSYGLGVGVSIAAFLVCHLWLQLEILGSFLVIMGVLIVLFPLILRISRNIWINLFLHYDKNAVPKKTNAAK
ncbi:MAG TPA: DUF983 domain-containing protein [Flavobacteriaceae bacterium]|nr:DUF983 domain-containing protein [Flavobacteriaceae bacterium]